MAHKLGPIKRENIEEAAKIIDKEGMPASYVGEYMVMVESKPYHFKYITRLAYKLATGEEVEPDYFQNNENYRQKIIDLGFSVITQNQNIMIKNPFRLSDEKISTLLKAYNDWLSKHPEEQSYNNRMKEDNDQIQETFLNQAYLDDIKNAQFKGDIKAYISKLDGPVGIRLGDLRITNNLTKLKNNFRYIITAKDDPFLVVNSLLDGKKKIDFFSKAFWSPVLQAKYPDIIPNWNNKTENLLKVLGVNVKTNKLNTAEKLRKISEAFKYLQQLDPKLNFFHLNHLMHYGFVIEEGKMLIDKLLDDSADIETTPVPLLKIYEIKRNAPERNYPMLLDKDNQSFFWNQQKFANNQPGDMVFVVSKPNKEALFVTLAKKGIETKYDITTNSSSFDFNGITYRCEGEWDSFTHFRINQEAAVPADWNWTRIIGQAETYNLWNPTIDKIPERLQKIDDLLKLFTNGEAYDKLVEYKAILAGNKPEEEIVNGLIAGDSGDWPEEYIAALKGQNHITIWWDKKPSGGEKVLQQLKSKIKKDQFFYFFISVNNKAKYKIKIVDYALEDDYATKKWNLNDDVAEFSEHFHDYVSVTKSGKERKAQIIFLADEIVKLDIPIPVDRFVFYEGFQAPTQNNIQPFVEILPDVTPYPEPRVKMKTKHRPLEIVKHVHRYTSSQGFKYDEKDIANFYLSLKTKPFVILAGISGTGKTKLVELFAESIGYGDPEHCVIIPVKPDWTDNSDLMGYTNLNKEFEKKKLTEVILNAHKNPDEPYFIILDEMNLARVEHYFSDFLSIIETRSLKDNKIITKPLLCGSEVGDNTKERESLINIRIPENLYIIGTVNMDETTFPFSKKVLDRANSIEMNQIELNFIKQAEEVEQMSGVFNDFLRSDKINSKHLSEEDHLLLDKKKFTDELLKINGILARVDLQFAYRIRDEMAFYLLNSDKISEIMSWEEAMDYQVMQKILPRIQGSAISISHVLINLINHLMAEKGKFNEKAHYEEIQDSLNEFISSNPKYSRTLKKLDFMLRRYSQDGFTSFWI